jgi:hypothetical protein
MSERALGERLRAVGLVLALGLGAVACASNNGSEQTPSTLAPQPSIANNGIDRDFKTTLIYTPSGKRIIHHTFSDSDFLGYVPDIYQECVNGEVVTSSEGYRRESSASVYPDAICADGKITPEDFSQPPATAPTTPK